MWSTGSKRAVGRGSGSPRASSPSPTATSNGYFAHKFDVTCSNPKFSIEVFLRSKPDGEVFHEVGGVDGGALLSARIPSSGWFTTSSSDYTGGRLWKSLSVSCRDTCSHECPSPDENDLIHRAANLYKSGIDVYRRWGYFKHGEEGAFMIEYPHPEGNSSATISVIKASEDVWEDNHRVAHEFGHAYHKRAMDLDGKLSEKDWCSGHSWHVTPDLDEDNPSKTRFSQTCGTAEGWANFFAMATYFDPDAPRPYYSYCGDACDDGGSFACDCSASNLSTDCERRCRKGELARQLGDGLTWNRGWSPATWSSGTNRLFTCVRPTTVTSKYPPHVVEGNVARFFWDAYDTDSSDDEFISLSRAELLEGWESMPKNGYGNGKVKEPRDRDGGWDDRNGRNVRDYIRAGGFTGAVRNLLGAALTTNCLTGQTDN